MWGVGYVCILNEENICNGLDMREHGIALEVI